MHEDFYDITGITYTNNPLSDDKSLVVSKLKRFADDK